MGIVLMLHSLWRWVVLALAIIALLKFALGWLQKKNPDTLDRRLLLAFTASLDLQVLLGIILIVNLFLTGASNRTALEHTIVMLVAAVVAHTSAIWRKRADNLFLRNNAAIVLVTLLLIIVGVSSVNGWHF